MEESVKEENTRKKEYLKSYGRAVKERYRLEDEIEQLRLDKMFPSVFLDDMPHSHNQTDLSGYMARLDDLERKVRNKIVDNAILRREINMRINLMNDESQKSILWWRYIKGLAWDQIAKEMHYERETVCRKHGKALINFPL